MDSPEKLVRAYYDTLDEHAYDDLAGLLDPEFTQKRPDRTFEDREAFVAFMRDDRPQSDTTHEIERVFVEGSRAAVQGRLLDAAERGSASPRSASPREDADERSSSSPHSQAHEDADGETLFRFADVHAIEDGRIVHLRTYTQ